jgi:hypothetical protein
MSLDSRLQWLLVLLVEERILLPILSQAFTATSVALYGRQN